MTERSTEDPHVLTTAEAIADGAPVDWKTTRTETSEEHSAVLDELRILENLAHITGGSPETWGSFSIVGELGRGSFGIVYHAVDVLQREVALKILASRPERPVDLKRALKEARRLAKSSHTNVVTVFGVERIGEEVGISMELIKGQTLEDLVERNGPYSANEATLIAIDLARALGAVHAAGLIHGDVKARNVMREAGGRTVLMDFGAGRDEHEGHVPGEDIAGTPIYLAPEVFAGRGRSRSSDLYSLGVLLYFLVSGAYPVEGQTATEIGRRQALPQSRKPLRDRRPDLPDGFIRVVERALTDRPEQRWKSANDLGAALAGLLPSVVWDTGRRPRELKTFAFATAAVLAGALLIGVATFDRLADLWPLERAQVQLSNASEADVASAPPAPPAEATVEYRIEAAFFVERNGAETRLQPDGRLTPGDRVHLQLQASVPVHVYVVNEDEQGQSFLLFPLRSETQPNPLPPGQRHRLPGITGNQQLSWQVTSAGGREHFLIFATPEAPPAIEQLVASLPLPTFNRPVQETRLSQNSLGLLRGVGGLVSDSLAGQLYLIPEFSTPLRAGEETVTGTWVRQMTIDNPVP